jgi:integrase
LRQSEEREAAQQAWETQGHVFTMEDGRALDPAYVTRLFQKNRTEGETATRADLPRPTALCRVAVARHRTDISIFSKLLGHSSISVTADIYAHMLKGVGQRAVDGVADLIAHTVHTQRAVSG